MGGVKGRGMAEGAVEAVGAGGGGGGRGEVGYRDSFILSREGNSQHFYSVDFLLVWATGNSGCIRQ